MQGQCLACGRTGIMDRCHIKTKGSGGPDEPWNIILLCRLHHVEQHKIGIITFVSRYEVIWTQLKKHGWYFLSGKLWNDKIGSTS